MSHQSEQSLHRDGYRYSQKRNMFKAQRDSRRRSSALKNFYDRIDLDSNRPETSQDFLCRTNSNSVRTEMVTVIKKEIC
jgi:hypothetical protein